MVQRVEVESRRGEVDVAISPLRGYDGGTIRFQTECRCYSSDEGILDQMLVDSSTRVGRVGGHVDGEGKLVGTGGDRRRRRDVRQREG